MKRHQQADGVEAVAGTTDGEAQPDTELIDECTTKETKNSKSTIQCSVLHCVSPQLRPKIMGVDFIAYHVIG